jgi:hypothetical protein
MMVMNPFLKENREKMKSFLHYAVNSESSMDELSTSDGARDFAQVYPDSSGASPLKKRGNKTSISASMPSLHSTSFKTGGGSGELRMGRAKSIDFGHNEDIENLFNFLGKSLQKLEVDILDRHSPTGSSSGYRKEVMDGLTDSFNEMKRLIENSMYADAETKKKNQSIMGRIGKLGKMFVASSTLPSMYLHTTL